MPNEQVDIHVKCVCGKDLVGWIEAKQEPVHPDDVPRITLRAQPCTECIKKQAALTLVQAIRETGGVT